MTTSIRQPPPPELRQHTDPPGLWAIVMTGSLVLNGILVLGGQHYLHLQQAKPSPPDLKPISIEFLQTIPQPPVETTYPTPPRSGATTNQPTITPTTSTPFNPAPNSSIARHSSASTTSTGIRLNTSDKNKSAKTPSTQPTQPSQLVASQSQTNPRSTNQPLPSTPAPPDTASIGSEESDAIAKSGISLPDFTDPPDPQHNSGEPSTGVQTTVALNQTLTTAKFLMQLKVLPQVSDQASDRPTSATPPLEKIFFSEDADKAECTVTPEAQRYFEQPLKFSITLNRKGEVTEVVPMPTSPSETAPLNDQQSYRNLATCFLKTWTLPLASLPNSAAQSALNQLNVQITLQKQ